MNALRAAIVRGARHVHAGGTVARGTRPGDGYVFDRLRSYADGDDPRRIDWPAMARSGALQTRVYLEESVLVLGAVLDASPSMRVGRKRALSDSAEEALRAWFGAAETTDRTIRVEEGEPFDLHRTLELAVRALPAGSSFLLVTDGLDVTADGTFTDVLLRSGRRFDATALIPRDPWADGLPLHGFVRLRDAETGRARRVFIGSRGRDRYRQASLERDTAIRERFECARWRIGTLDETDGRASLERTFGLR